jgi:hypothetical protein
LLEQNQDKIDWEYLTLNPNAIHLLEQNQDKIDWLYLNINPNAIHLFEQNKDRIIWLYFSSNPNIFTYDNDDLNEQLEKLTIMSKLF